MLSRERRESYGMAMLRVRGSRKENAGKVSQTMFVFKSALWIFFMSFSLPTFLCEREASFPVWENDLVIAGRCEGVCIPASLISNQLCSSLSSTFDISSRCHSVDLKAELQLFLTVHKYWPHVGNMLPANISWCTLLPFVSANTDLLTPMCATVFWLSYPPPFPLRPQTTLRQQPPPKTWQTRPTCKKKVGGVYLSAPRP